MSAERLFAILGGLIFFLWFLGVVGAGDFVLKYSFFDNITCREVQQ